MDRAREERLVFSYRALFDKFDQLICYPNPPRDYSDCPIVPIPFEEWAAQRPCSNPLQYHQDNLPRLISLFQNQIHAENICEQLLDLIPLLESVYKGHLECITKIDMKAFFAQHTCFRPYLHLHYLILIQHIVSFISQPQPIKWPEDSNSSIDNDNETRTKPIGHTTHLIGQCSAYSRATMHLLGLRHGERTPWRMPESEPDHLDHITGEIFYDIIFEAKKLKSQHLSRFGSGLTQLFQHQEQEHQADEEDKEEKPISTTASPTIPTTSSETQPILAPLFPHEYHVKHNWDVFDHINPNGKLLEPTAVPFPPFNEDMGHIDDRYTLRDQFRIVPISLNRQLAVVIDACIDIFWYFAEDYSENMPLAELETISKTLVPQLSLPYTRLQTSELIVTHLLGLSRGYEDDDDGSYFSKINVGVINALVSKYFSSITLPITPSIGYSMTQQNSVSTSSLSASTALLTFRLVKSSEPQSPFNFENPSAPAYLFPLYSHLSDSYMIWLHHRERIDKRFQVRRVPSPGNLHQDALDGMGKWFVEHYCQNEQHQYEQKQDGMVLENSESREDQKGHLNNAISSLSSSTALIYPPALSSRPLSEYRFAHNPLTIPLDQPIYKSITCPNSFFGPFAQPTIPILDGVSRALNFPILPEFKGSLNEFNWTDPHLGKALKQSILLSISNFELSADLLDLEPSVVEMIKVANYPLVLPFKHPSDTNPNASTLPLQIRNCNPDYQFSDPVFLALSAVGDWTNKLYNRPYYLTSQSPYSKIPWNLDIHANISNPIILLSDLLFEYVYHVRNLNIDLIHPDDEEEVELQALFPMEIYEKSLKPIADRYKSTIIPGLLNSHFSPHPRLNKCHPGFYSTSGISIYFSTWAQEVTRHWESFFIGNVAYNLNYWLRAAFGTKRIRYRQIYKNDCKPSKSNVQNYDLYIHPEMTTLYKDSSLCLLTFNDEYQQQRQDDPKGHLANPRLFLMLDNDLYTTHTLFHQLLTSMTGIDKSSGRKRFQPYDITDNTKCSNKDNHATITTENQDNDGGAENQADLTSSATTAAHFNNYSLALTSSSDNIIIEELSHGYMFLLHHLLFKNLGEDLFFLASSSVSGLNYRIKHQYNGPMSRIDCKLYLDLLNALHKFIFQPTVVSFNQKGSASFRPQLSHPTQLGSPTSDPLFDQQSPLDPTTFYLKQHPQLLQRPLYALYCDTLLWLLHGFSYSAFETSKKNNSSTLHPIHHTILHSNWYINGLPGSTLLLAHQSIKKQLDKYDAKCKKYRENAAKLKKTSGKRVPPPPDFVPVDDYDYNQNRTKITPDLLRVAGDRYLKQQIRRIGCGEMDTRQIDQKPQLEKNIDDRNDETDEDNGEEENDKKDEENEVTSGCQKTSSVASTQKNQKIPISTEYSSAMVQFMIESFIDLLLHPTPWAIIQTLDFTQKKQFPDLVPMSQIDTIIPTLEDLFAPSTLSTSDETTMTPQDCHHDVNSMGLFLDPQHSSSPLQYRQLAQRFIPPQQMEGVDNDITIFGTGSKRAAPILYPKTPQHFGFFSSLPKEELNAIYTAFDLHNITPVYGRQVTINNGQLPVGLPQDPFDKDLDYIPIYYHHKDDERIPKPLPANSRIIPPCSMFYNEQFDIERKIKEAESQLVDAKVHEVCETSQLSQSALLSHPTQMVTMAHQSSLAEFSIDYSNYFNIDPNEIAKGLNYLAKESIDAVSLRDLSITPRIHSTDRQIQKEMERFYGLDQPPKVIRPSAFFFQHDLQPNHILPPPPTIQTEEEIEQKRLNLLARDYKPPAKLQTLPQNFSQTKSFAHIDYKRLYEAETGGDQYYNKNFTHSEYTHCDKDKTEIVNTRPLSTPIPPELCFKLLQSPLKVLANRPRDDELL